MDKTGAERLARNITVASHGDRPPGSVNGLSAKPQPLTPELGRYAHGWAVEVTTYSGSRYMVIDAGNLIRSLDDAEKRWNSVAAFAAFTLRREQEGA